MAKPDITTREDIIRMVDGFYSRVRTNDVLGPIFKEVIGNDWTPHLDKMYSFWETLLLGAQSYSGRPFPPHAKLPIDETHFALWLTLFRENLEQWEGPIKEEASNRAGLMAGLFQHKLEHFRAAGRNMIQ